MEKPVYILLFLSFLLRVSCFKCPPGSSQIPTENVCIFAINQTQTYPNATRQCESFGGISVKIRSAFESSYVSAMIGQELNGVLPYIGVERRNNAWVYADGSSLAYQNWATNEPNNSNSCAVMDPKSGKWLSAECANQRPFFCSMGRNAFQCPDGWTYSEITDYCYYLQNFTFTDGVHWKLYDAKTAESMCQAMTAHLVSIHSQPEEDFVYNLITANVFNLTTPDPDERRCGAGEWTWIGLFGDGTIGNGTWTDGSPVDYAAATDYTWSRWNTWAMCNDESCGCRKWGWFDWNFARFLCKMAPKRSSVEGEIQKEKKI